MIDGNTKIIGRFHTIASPRGLNIYNPFFIEAKINALYLLFFNSDPKPLVDGLKNLRLAGAITAGFESESRLPLLLDELDESTKYVGRVGFIKNKNGKLKGYTQSGEGMLKTIEKTGSLANKKIVIVGAGNVAKALLYKISNYSRKPKAVEVYNRTVDKAEKLKSEFGFIKRAASLDELAQAKGDVLVNLTKMGGKQPDTLFNTKVVGSFNSIIDVTFETENTNLIQLAKKLNRNYATGWDMFTYQGLVVLETLLETPIDPTILRKHVVKGLSEVVK